MYSRQGATQIHVYLYLQVLNGMEHYEPIFTQHNLSLQIQQHGLRSEVNKYILTLYTYTLNKTVTDAAAFLGFRRLSQTQ